MIELQRIFTKLSYRQRRPVDGKGRNDRIHSRTVRKPSIYHWHGFIDPPPDTRDNFLDNLLEMCVVLETYRGRLQSALPLNEDLFVPIHENIVDSRIR